MAEQRAKTRLQAERLKRRWTQQEAADTLKVEVKTWSRWERGEQVAGPKRRRRLSALFKEEVDASWFDPLEMVEASSSQIFNVPYTRNPYFLDQKQHVEHLHERLHTDDVGAHCQAISGLGGIGKTQLALEYAYRYQEEYKVVLWVHAGMQTQLHGDLASLGKVLQVPETRKRVPKQRYLVNEVIHWLQTHQDWLLILDNVEEDIDTETSDDREDNVTIEKLLSVLKNGHILITTRSQSVARQAQNILLEAMQLEEGAQLLLQLPHQRSLLTMVGITRDSRQEEALKLSELLGGLPLALEQARAYIEATRCGFAEYRQLYEECRKQILQEVIKNSRLEKEYKESVATTWLISFRHVRQQFAPAADVLDLYAYLAPDAIPDDIVLKGAEMLHSNVHELAGNRIQFNRVRQVLLNYSLVSQHTEAPMLSIHRLVQAVLQDHMSDEKRQFWVEQALFAVEHTFSDALSKGQAVEGYIPHARVCATFIKKLELKGQEVAHLLEMVANAEYERGWYAQSRPLYLQAHAAAVDVEGSKDPHVLSLFLRVARVFMDLDASPLAAMLYKQIKKDYEQLFGSDDPGIVTCLNNLALAQMKVGALPEAEQTCRDALAWYKQVKKPDPAQQATTYHIAGQISEAFFWHHRTEAYYKAALDIRKRMLGTDHPDVAKSCADLGFFYAIRKKDVEQAEPLLWQAFEIRHRVLGHDHPDTAESLVYLGVLHWEKKDYEMAEEEYQQALTIRRQKLGPYHPDVVHTLHDLAELTAEQRKDEEAEQYFREMFALLPHAGGTESYDYAIVLEAYTRFLRSRGREDEAIEHEKKNIRLIEQLETRGPLQSLSLSPGGEGTQGASPTYMWFFRRQHRG